jgi:PiT family inorganic phosphate transporter
VRWGIAGRIIWAWVLTIPASAAVATVAFVGARLLVDALSALHGG